MAPPALGTPAPRRPAMRGLLAFPEAGSPATPDGSSFSSRSLVTFALRGLRSAGFRPRLRQALKRPLTPTLRHVDGSWTLEAGPTSGLRAVVPVFGLATSGRRWPRVAGSGPGGLVAILDPQPERPSLAMSTSLRSLVFPPPPYSGGVSGCWQRGEKAGSAHTVHTIRTERVAEDSTLSRASCSWPMGPSGRCPSLKRQAESSATLRACTRARSGRPLTPEQTEALDFLDSVMARGLYFQYKLEAGEMMFREFFTAEHCDPPSRAGGAWSNVWLGAVTSVPGSIRRHWMRSFG